MSQSKENLIKQETNNEQAVTLKENQLHISLFEANQRLDKFLLKYFNKAEKSFVYQMLRKKRIKYNGMKALGHEMLAEGDILTFYIAPSTMSTLMEEKTLKSAGPLDVVYEDENILICNKPVGLLCHPETAGTKDTLIDRVLLHLYQNGSYAPQKASTFTPATANRLDRNTGGLVVCGKNLRALQALNLAIKEHKIDKYYLAVACGCIEKPMVLSGYLEKDGNNNKSSINQMGVGKPVTTQITPLSFANNKTLLDVKLVTGRSHQIRVHLQSIGHPLVGDPKYGTNQHSKGQLLHAYKLVFLTDTGVLAYLLNKSFTCNAPSSFGLFAKKQT